jgi:HAMP domain-containing protein
MLTINKTQLEKDFSKKKLQDTYNQHVSKVQARKHTLSQGGATMSMRTLGTSDCQGSGIIKTVILPNEEVNRLAIEAEELKQYLHAQKQVYEESVKSYDKDRLIREQEFEMKQ